MSNTTTVVGYYNGNRWPIQLVISKLNLTLTLEPGKYILDRAGRKINDPYFEVFANNKQLHRESSATPVPIIAIPEITAPVPPTTSNPVRAVTEWKRDERGIRQPVINQPQPPQTETAAALPPAVLASATSSVKPMSIEEARRLGLVRKVREVPEDYGVNDTTGLPPGGIPKMRYSTDPGVHKPAPPLPKEMLALPKDDPANPDRAKLVAGLAQGSAVPAPENASSNPFANTAVANAPVNSPITAGTPVAQPITESAPVVPVAAPPVIHPHAAQIPVDEPDDVEEPDIEPVLTGGFPEPDLPPAAAQPPVAPAAAAPLLPIAAANQFVCGLCGHGVKYRSQLEKHAIQKHPDRVRAIMAAYPVTPPQPPT